MKAYVSEEICTACKGACCKHLPGAVWPEDLGADLESATREMLQSGKYAVDWWEGDVRGGERCRSIFLRPATKGKEGQIFDSSWGGECTFLMDGGCCLEHDERPRGCRLLEPKKGDRCVYHGKDPKADAAEAWYPFAERIEQIADEIEV